MSLFFYFSLSGLLVWLVVAAWLKVPLRGEETRKQRLGSLMEWLTRGAIVPMGIWVFINLGAIRWMPPFLPQVQAAKNTGGPWVGEAIRLTLPAIPLIVSYWAWFSFLLICLRLLASTEDRARFKQAAYFWSLVLAPICGIMIFIGGIHVLGVAMVLWLAPIVHVCLPRVEEIHYAPSYSQATAKLKFGKYSEAELNIIEELESCENDFKGWMMLAELYAVHFHDFEQAEQAVIDLCEQPDIEPSNACVALHRLADWYLELKKDPDGARRCMDAISKRYPRTHLDRMARLRLRRMPRTVEELEDMQIAKPLHLPALQEDLEDTPTPDEGDPEAIRMHAETLSRRLAADPNDGSLREEFARTLARLSKMEAAIDQLDLLLAAGDQPAKRRAEWMALKAGWTAQWKGEGAEFRGMLQRIIDEYPTAPQAMAAQRRLLRLEERARVAKYAKAKKRPRIVISPDPSPDPSPSPPPTRRDQS